MGGDGSYKTIGCRSHAGGGGWMDHRTFHSSSCTPDGAACRAGRGCGGVGGCGASKLSVLAACANSFGIVKTILFYYWLLFG